MIQDLENKKLYNQYRETKAEEKDLVFCFDQDKLLVKKLEDKRIVLPEASHFEKTQCQYLFRIEEQKFFLVLEKQEADGYTWEPVRNLRRLCQKELAFAAATAYHLYQWYRDNKFCGRCGAELAHDKRERMMKCPVCGNAVYPKIAPAVIVAVTDGERILLTQYSGRVYKSYALIAGFTEIGETAEETVIREVMEEVGLKVKNIKYYKSQPWGTDSNLLLGFFCQLDGEDKIKMDTEELSTAQWFKRGEIPVGDDGFSLTREMIAVFEKGGIENA